MLLAEAEVEAAVEEDVAIPNSKIDTEMGEMWTMGDELESDSDCNGGLGVSYGQWKIVQNCNGKHVDVDAMQKSLYRITHQNPLPLIFAYMWTRVFVVANNKLCQAHLG